MAEWRGETASRPRRGTCTWAPLPASGGRGVGHIIPELRYSSIYSYFDKKKQHLINTFINDILVKHGTEHLESQMGMGRAGALRWAHKLARRPSNAETFAVVVTESQGLLSPWRQARLDWQWPRNLLAVEAGCLCRVERVSRCRRLGPSAFVLARLLRFYGSAGAICCCQRRVAHSVCLHVADAERSLAVSSDSEPVDLAGWIPVALLSLVSLWLFGLVAHRHAVV